MEMFPYFIIWFTTDHMVYKCKLLGHIKDFLFGLLLVSIKIMQSLRHSLLSLTYFKRSHVVINYCTLSDIYEFPQIICPTAIMHMWWFGRHDISQLKVVKIEVEVDGWRLRLKCTNDLINKLNNGDKYCECRKRLNDFILRLPYVIINFTLWMFEITSMK